MKTLPLFGCLVPMSCRWRRFTLAKTGKYDAVIALGTVIRGGTAHFEYVMVVQATAWRMLPRTAEIPVAFGVLTTESINKRDRTCWHQSWQQRCKLH